MLAAVDHVAVDNGRIPPSEPREERARTLFPLTFPLVLLLVFHQRCRRDPRRGGQVADGPHTDQPAPFALHDGRARYLRGLGECALCQHRPSTQACEVWYAHPRRSAGAGPFPFPRL